MYDKSCLGSSRHKPPCPRAMSEPSAREFLMEDCPSWTVRQVVIVHVTPKAA
jgi:hypothetical protein